MTSEKLEKHELAYLHEDKIATQKDLRILTLELQQKISESEQLSMQRMMEMKIELLQKINSITIKLGSLIIACSGILFGLLSYFHK